MFSLLNNKQTLTVHLTVRLTNPFVLPPVQVNFLTFVGDKLKLSSPELAAVLGSNAQVMNIYMVGQGLLQGIYNTKVKT